MSEKIISFNFDKKQAIILCKQAISSKMAIIRDGGDALQCGAPPDITFNVLIKDHEIRVSGGGPGAYLAETAAKEIERAVQEYQNPSVRRRTAPQQTVQSQPPRQQQRIDRDDLSPAEYLELLSKGGDIKTEEKVASNNQSIPANSPQTVREEPSSNYAVEEPADFSNELETEAIINGSAKNTEIAKCEKMVRVSKIVCMVIFIAVAFFSFLDIIFYFLGFTHGPAMFVLFAVIAIVLSIPTLIFLIQKKLRLFAIFGFIMIEPAVVASADAISAVLKINAAPLWSIDLIVFVVFGIILLINVSKLQRMKKS